MPILPSTYNNISLKYSFTVHFSFPKCWLMMLHHLLKVAQTVGTDDAHKHTWKYFRTKNLELIVLLGIEISKHFGPIIIWPFFWVYKNLCLVVILGVKVPRNTNNHYTSIACVTVNNKMVERPLWECRQFQGLILHNIMYNTLSHSSNGMHSKWTIVMC